MRRTAAALALGTALLAGTGCSSDDGQTNATSGDPETSVPPPTSATSSGSSGSSGSSSGGSTGSGSGAPSEADVLSHLGAEDDVVTLPDGTECTITAVATDADAVAQREQAGDPVATTADGGVGVVLADDADAACQEAITDMLADLGGS